MDWVDWFAIIAGGVSVVSGCFNIWQAAKNKHARRAARDHGQRTFANVYKIAEWIDEAGKIINQPADNSPEKRLCKVMSLLDRIRGAALAERQACVSSMREHLGRVPRREHPAFPNGMFLEKCRRYEQPKGADNTREEAET